VDQIIENRLAASASCSLFDRQSADVGPFSVIITFVGKLAPMRGVCLDHPAPVSGNAEAAADGHDAPRHAASAAYEGAASHTTPRRTDRKL